MQVFGSFLLQRPEMRLGLGGRRVDQRLGLTLGRLRLSKSAEIVEGKGAGKGKGATTSEVEVRIVDQPQRLYLGRLRLSTAVEVKVKVKEEVQV